MRQAKARAKAALKHSSDEEPYPAPIVRRLVSRRSAPVSPATPPSPVPHPLISFDEALLQNDSVELGKYVTHRPQFSSMSSFEGALISSIQADSSLAVEALSTNPWFHPNVLTESKQYFLHLAVECNSPNALFAMLRHGLAPLIEQQNTDNMTPIMLAVKLDRPDPMHVLLYYSANFFASNGTTFVTPTLALRGSPRVAAAARAVLARGRSYRRLPTVQEVLDDGLDGVLPCLAAAGVELPSADAQCADAYTRGRLMQLLGMHEEALVYMNDAGALDARLSELVTIDDGFAVLLSKLASAAVAASAVDSLKVILRYSVDVLPVELLAEVTTKEVLEVLQKYYTVDEFVDKVIDILVSLLDAPVLDVPRIKLFVSSGCDLPLVIKTRLEELGLTL